MSGSPNTLQTKPMQAPMLSGGLEQMNMLNAFRQGASWDQLNAMNPVSQRPVQFLPPAMPQFDYMAQFHQQQEAAKAPAPVAPAPVNNYAYLTDGGGGGVGDGGVGDSGGGGGGGGAK